MANDCPQSAPTDDVTQAFEALRGEVSLTRVALEGLTAARDRVPDYSVTLGQIVQVQREVASDIVRIGNSPAIGLSPSALAAEIVTAGADARAADRTLITETRDALLRSIGRIDGIVERGQATDRQMRRLVWAGAGGTFAGMVMMAILPGAIARSLPVSWHVPEWMAARTMGLDQQTAGERMIRTAPPRRSSTLSRAQR